MILISLKLTKNVYAAFLAKEPHTIFPPTVDIPPVFFNSLDGIPLKVIFPAFSWQYWNSVYFLFEKSTANEHEKLQVKLLICNCITFES